MFEELGGGMVIKYNGCGGIKKKVKFQSVKVDRTHESQGGVFNLQQVK